LEIHWRELSRLSARSRHSIIGKRQGRGQVVDAAIYESILAIMESLVPEYTIENYTRERSGSYLPAIAPSNIYDGSDGMVIIAANQNTVFARLCDAMGRPELKDDPRYATHVARGENQVELDDLINDWTKTRTIDEVEAVMIEHSVPVGKVYRARDMLDDPHYAAREALVDLASERWGAIKMQNVFPKLSSHAGVCALDRAGEARRTHRAGADGASGPDTGADRKIA
jgi:crotonobetainyl-CoA:carnitine CoA-transferase CaiB-like acyl-CoA transferase